MTHQSHPEPGNPHSNPVQIVINGESMEVHQKQLPFEKICHLAFPQGPFGGNVRYTVTYRLPDGREGSMVQGDVIEVVKGMVFYVGNTDRS